MTELTNLMDQLAVQEGVNTTHLPGVYIYKKSESIPRVPLCYGQGIIYVGQGKKRLFYGGKTYQYDPDNYLVLAMPVPAECETHATFDKPLLSMMVDLDLQVMRNIIDMLGYDLSSSSEINSKAKGLQVSPTNPVINDIVHRLLRALHSSIDAKLLGKQIVRELFFRILQGDNRNNLLALTMKNTDLARVNKALQLIHSNYEKRIDVNSLAGMVNMSMSTFHRTFKDVTASSPIQYLKKVRLTKARSLMVEEGLRVNEAATEVGYESSAQFSREFKRFFGHNPVECR